MYWTDWSRENPRIMKASMDGNKTTIKAIVTGTSNVFWPNGITIDHREMKIYWTDAHLDRISSANLDGSEIKWLVHGTSLVPHPYAIGIYKVSFMLYTLLWIHYYSLETNFSWILL